MCMKWVSRLPSIPFQYAGIIKQLLIFRMPNLEHRPDEANYKVFHVLDAMKEIDNGQYSIS